MPPDIDPTLLTTIGASAMDALRSYGWLEERAPAHARVMPEGEKPATARAFHSPYVGVTAYRERWVCCWGKRGAVKTRMFPLTDAGEWDAAVERAQILGLNYVEKRDGSRIAL